MTDNNIIICLTGAERVGKDTVADYLVTQHEFKKYSVADPMKSAIKMILGLTDEQVNGPAKDELDPVLSIVPRDFIIWFGTNICRQEMHDVFPQLQIPRGTIWAAKMGKWIRQQINQSKKDNRGARIVIPDIRFLAETDVLANIPEAKLVLVTRDNGRTLMKYDIPAILANPKTHPQYTLNNNGNVDELYYSIDQFLYQISGIFSI